MRCAEKCCGVLVISAPLISAPLSELNYLPAFLPLPLTERSRKQRKRGMGSESSGRMGDAKKIKVAEGVIQESEISEEEDRAVEGAFLKCVSFLSLIVGCFLEPVSTCFTL